jgi:hypothetical protein
VDTAVPVTIRCEGTQGGARFGTSIRFDASGNPEHVAAVTFLAPAICVDPPEKHALLEADSSHLHE